MRIPALIMLAAMLCASCSVKEVREACPCMLEIDCSAFADVAGSVYMDLDGRVMERSVEDDEDMVSLFKVPKKEKISVAVWSGAQGDSLYFFGTSVQGMEETVKVSAVPHKQFASVLLKVLSSEENFVSFTVKSNYCGIDLKTGRTLPGNLSIPLSGKGGNYVFCLPRQASDSMLILEAGIENGVVQAYPLGEWIKMAGYDWTAADLDDIAVAADFSLGHYEVSIGEWDAGDASDQII